MRLMWWILLLLASNTGITHAASFNCAKAKSPQEIAICSSPALSEADEQMATAYQAWLTAAQPEWSDGIRANQRAWLRARAADCPAHLAAEQMLSCLGDAYRARIEDLRQMIQRKAGLTFVLRSITLTAPDTPGDNPIGVQEENPGFGTLSASWPQATGNTLEWSAWNHAIEDSTRESAMDSGYSANSPKGQWSAVHGVDSETTASIGVVSERLVTATIASLWDGHGAHPNHASVEFNWLLQQERALKPEDIFIPASGWDRWMLERIDRYLHHTLDTEMSGNYKSWFQPGEAQKVLNGIVMNPRRWQLNDTGLTIIFQPYEVACYACTPEPMTIPWKDMKSYLNPAFEIPR